MDIRDKILLSADIDINKWLNENFTEEQWNKIIEEIKKYINII